MQNHELSAADLSAYLDALLECERFRDYCPNGLQVEGRPRLRRILCGVTACQALIDAALEQGADALLVHHGWFWRGEEGRIHGIRRKRLKTLLEHDLALFAYHLPLDAHAELGNNAQLAHRMGWQVDGRFGEQEIGFLGRASGSAAQIARQLAAMLGREPLLAGEGGRTVQRIAWCSGGAQGWFEQAIAAGADLYVSGEISEQTVHLARESGVPYLAVGHHASERYGVQALGAHLEARFGIECPYVEIDNPA